jgi:hypothetical protein
MIIACVYMQRNVQSVHARAFAISRARACAAVYIKHFDSVAVSPYFIFRDRRMAQLSQPRM